MSERKNNVEIYDIRKTLRWVTAFTSMVFLLLTVLAIAFNWGIVVVSLFITTMYFFGLVYITIPMFYKSTGFTLFGAAFLALFSAPIVVYFLVVMIGMIKDQSSLLVVADSKTWILFAGSIIGGLMTMLAVYFSIKSSEKTTSQQIEKINDQIDLLKKQNEIIVQQHKENIELSKNELAVQSIPLLRVELISLPDKRGFSYLINEEESNDGDENFFEVQITLRFINSSSYIARSLDFSKFEITRSYNEGFGENEQYIEYESTVEDISDQINSSIQEVDAIPGNYSKDLQKFILLKLNKLSTMDILCELNYKDYNNTLTHKVRTTSQFFISICKEEHLDIIDGIGQKMLHADVLLVKQSENHSFLE
jgi:NADH:ubiquinone oxidoreductase subunit 6 (subunit J)